MTLCRFASLASPLLAFLAFSPWQAHGQTPVLLKDINQVTGKNPSSDPKEFASLGALTFFAATTAQEGRELWVSDGSAKATRLFADLVPGLNGSDPVQLTVVGSRIFFLAWDPIHGRELWQTDGTKAGTVLVQDIRPGIADAEITNLVAVGSRLYFVANDGTNGAELWKSDGSGAALVTDLYKGSSGSKPKNLVRVGTQVFFTAIEPSVGREIHRSDGTQKGTVLVADLTPGVANSYMRSLTGVGKALYFVWGSVQNGEILWKSDGTAKGTKALVKKDWGYILSLASLGNRLLLTAIVSPTWKAHLYATDGTSTSILQSATTIDLHRGVSTGRTMYYVASVQGSKALWRTDGLPKSTSLVKSMDMVQIQPFGSKLSLLTLRPQTSPGYDLWSSDGTSQGMTLVTSFLQNYKLEMHGTASSLLIAMDDNKLGRELWVRKATPTSVGTLIDLDARGQTGDSHPAMYDQIGKWLLFGADDGISGFELWRTDGTGKGTSRVKDIHPGKASGLILGVKLGSKFILVANDGKTGHELWLSDGTSAGTTLLKDIWPGPKSGAPSRLIRCGKLVYFLANDGIHGVEIWRTDGTAAGTRLLADLNKGPMRSWIFRLTPFRDEIYFVMIVGGIPYNQLWRSDGTTQGTIKFSNLNLADPIGGHPDQLAVYRGHMYFQATDWQTGNELWRTDGTTKGTSLLKDIASGRAHSEPESLLVAGDLLYFTAKDAAHGRELWRSDGTTAGTRLVIDLKRGPGSAMILPIYEFGEDLIFLTVESRQALWRTRGTTASTAKIAEGLSAWRRYVVAGSRRSWGFGLTPQGPALWSLGGTPKGVRIEQVSRHTHPSASPGTGYWGSAIKIHQGMLFFASWNAIHGTELWMLDPGAISEPVGHACSPTHLLPEMSVTDPVLGGTMEFKGIKTPPQSAALLLLGAQAPQPAPLTSTCSLYIDLRIFAIYRAFLTQGDSWKQPLFLPNQTSLMGMQVLAQTVFFRPGSGFSTTKGRLLTLGN